MRESNQWGGRDRSCLIDEVRCWEEVEEFTGKESLHGDLFMTKAQIKCDIIKFTIKSKNI